MTEQLRLQWIKASELSANPKNWRRHPTEQVGALRESIEKVGWAGALLYNETTGRLIDGHARKEIFDDSNAEVPVLVGSWSEEDEAVILATLDPISGLATRDSEAFLDLLKEVGDIDGSLGDLIDDLGKKAGALLTSKEDDEVDDEIEVTVGLGELYLVGRHRVMCGDSTSEEDVARLLGDCTPGIMVTDPPYGVNYDPSWREEAVKRGLASFGTPRRLGKVSNDGNARWSPAWELHKGSVAYVWHSALHSHEVMEDLSSTGFLTKTQIIWTKPMPPLSRGHYHWAHEPCWYAARKGKSAQWCGGRSQNTVWHVAAERNDSEDKGKLHGTRKPLELMARPIRNHKFDDVYDPFLGSGTTAIAAEQSDRRCFGMDIDPTYVEMAIQRIERETGAKREVVS